MHSYILKEIAPNVKGATSSMPVSYDSWFGIGKNFTSESLKHEVDRAAEIGCEYFTVDCGWALDPWSRGTVVDVTKFPQGLGDFADYVRSKGMRVGLWNAIENPRGMANFHWPWVQDAHRRTLRKWRDEWDLQWMRLEGSMIPTKKEGLKAQKAMRELYSGFMKENPEFYIEGCHGGGCRMDLNMIRLSHGTWLNDHTANADVCRFAQTGGLRVWPARYLNMAIETYPGMGDTRAYGHYFLSRMPGVLTFNGDIAQWSANATALAKKHVDVFKQIRQYKEQNVFFPLRQPRNPDDWDAVVFGDGSGDAQLLFVFRMDGEDEQFMKIPDAPGNWEALLNNGNGKLEREKNGWRVTLNMNSSALWIRKGA
jgi:alpha-galactosidase